MTKKSTVLVTGAAGYLGSTLCASLLESGYRVLALDNLFYNETSLFHLCAHPDFEFVFGDARDAGLIKSLVAKADAIIPLAAMVGVGVCNRDPEMTRSTNFGAIELLNLSLIHI